MVNLSTTGNLRAGHHNDGQFRYTDTNAANREYSSSIEQARGGPVPCHLCPCHLCWRRWHDMHGPSPCSRLCFHRVQSARTDFGSTNFVVRLWHCSAGHSARGYDESKVPTGLAVLNAHPKSPCQTGGDAVKRSPFTLPPCKFHCNNCTFLLAMYSMRVFSFLDGISYICIHIEIL